MKLVSAMIALVLIAGANMAHAQQRRKSLAQEFSGQGYGMAGCGLGSVVFGQQTGMVQIFAATTNGTSGNQTFGISSGTLNCGESSRTAKAEQFIDVNKVAIENDMARGQGETLTALSQVMACTNTNFSADMRSDYRQMFPQGGATADQLSAVAAKACGI
jgi:hypothetical protein